MPKPNLVSLKLESAGGNYQTILISFPNNSLVDLGVKTIIPYTR